MYALDMLKPQAQFATRTPEDVSVRLERIFALIEQHPDVFALSLNAQGEQVTADGRALDEPIEIPTDPNTKIPTLIHEYFRNRYDRYVSFDETTDAILDEELPHVIRQTEEKTAQARRFRSFQVYVGRVSIFQHEARTTPVVSQVALPNAS
jgi:hypothetical protein